MNQLLADYNAARKAIFDHCGETEHADVFPLRFPKLEHWSIDSTHSVLLHGPDQELAIEGGASYVRRGETITLVPHDETGECGYVWLVLDNALEIKQ